MGTTYQVLLLHPELPGQFRHLLRALAADSRLTVTVLGEQVSEILPGGVRAVTTLPPAAPTTRHPYLLSMENLVNRGQAVLLAAAGLAREGYRPDLIIGHNGFGSLLYLKDLWPHTPMVGYFEYYYRAQGADLDCDPEYPPSLGDMARVRTLNAINLLGLEAADLAVTPTYWQRDLHPAAFRQAMVVLHDGVDTALAAPRPPADVNLPSGVRLMAGEEILTYAARDLEPYRGFHTFMRALPEILRRRPAVRVVVAGREGVSYGRPPRRGSSYRAELQDELGEGVDWSRVHFVGTLPHGDFLRLMTLSSVHVYLSYPFVLSWSVLEAMACGALVVGADTAPLREVVRHGVNGLLVPPLDPVAVADGVATALADGAILSSLRREARRTVVSCYDAANCAVPAWRQALTRHCDAPPVRGKLGGCLQGI